MKPLPLLLASTALVALFSLPACKKQETTSEKVSDRVNDALDNRPGEPMRDAAEDTKDAVKDAADDVKDAVK